MMTGDKVMMSVIMIILMMTMTRMTMMMKMTMLMAKFGGTWAEAGQPRFGLDRNYRDHLSHRVHKTATIPGRMPLYTDAGVNLAVGQVPTWIDTVRDDVRVVSDLNIKRGTFIAWQTLDRGQWRDLIHSLVNAHT